MADNKLELILSLSIAQFQQAVEQVGATLNAMSGRIGTAMNGADSGFKKVIASSQAYNNTLQSLNGTADHFKNTMAQMAGVLGGAAIFGGAARQAVSFNSTVEQSRIGVAALVRTFTNADMGQSFVQAEDIQKRLQIAGLQTSATYEELLRALQEGIGPALREGFNPQQVVAFTQSMTLAGSALALPMDQLGQELRAVLDGTIDRNARIATALRITNEDVKGWKEAGTLFDNLKKKLQAFSAAGKQSAKTFAVAWSNVQDAVQMALGKASEDSFKKTTEFFLKLKDAIVTVDEAAGTATFNEKIMAAFAGVDSAISKAIGSLTTEQISAMLVSLVGTFGAVAEAVVTFVASLMKVGEALGPLGPTIASVITWATLLFGSFKLLVGLPILLYQQLVALNSGFAALAGGGLLLYIKHVQLASQHTGIFRTAIASIPNALATASGLMGAALAGYAIGTFFYDQSDIVKKAGNRIAATLTLVALKAKQAWAWLSGGDTAAVQREIEAAERIYAELYLEIGSGAKNTAETQAQSHQKAAAAADQSANKQKQVTAAALDEMKKKYQEYATEVKRLQKEIVSEEISTDQQLRDMKRQTMSEPDAWQDKQKQAKEYAVVAKAAGDAAKLALEGGDQAKAKELFSTSIEYAEMAKKQFGELGVEVKSGEKVISSQAENIKIAMAGIEVSSKTKIEALKGMQDAAMAAMNVLTEKSGFKDLSKGMDAAEENWLKNWQSMRAGAIKDIEAVEERLVQIKDREITVWINEKERRSSGGMIGALRMAAGGTVTAFRNMLSGGYFPGFGGGDRRHVVAEDGEYMFDKDRVRDAGLYVVRAFHAGRYDIVVSELLKRMRGTISRQFGGIIDSMQILPSIGPQLLAAGGPVQVSGNAPMIRHEHILRAGNASAKVYTDDLNAGRLLAVFERGRRMSS